MTTLGSWLKNKGFNVDDNNVPYGRESTWRGVDFLMVHHTVSDCDGSESSIASYCRTGGSGTYPPLCQIVLGHSGKVWMTSKERSGQSDPGRASHAGSGSGYGVPTDTMNEYALGIECQCDGSHKIATHETQYKTLISLLAALSEKYNVPTKNIIGHKEWSNTGKVDPKDDMNKIRSDVAAELEEDDMELKYDYLEKPDGTQTIGRSYTDLEMSKWDSPFKGWENTLVYLNILPKFIAGKTHGSVVVRLYRESGDSHAPKTIPIDIDDLTEDGKFYAEYLTFEQSEQGKWTKIQVKCEGGLESVKLGTRYTTKALLG
jgi:N-acetylmuramoyl-L-alanine amidase